MKQYLDLLRHVLEHGETRTDRTGVGTKQLFGPQLRFDLRDGFPLITTKKVNFSLVVRELLWFLSGSTNVNDLVGAEQLWRAWAKPDGDLGPVYGHQWRNWGKTDQYRGTDQLSEVINTIKLNPSSRRILVSAWNVSDIPEMGLPPCHALYQFNVGFSDGVPRFLDCQLYQRSADLAIGVPFNIASYALLTTMIAQECQLTARYFIHAFGDAHIYLNHIDGVETQIAREPHRLPTVSIACKPVFDLTIDDIKLYNYDHHPFIKFDVAV